MTIIQVPQLHRFDGLSDGDSQKLAHWNDILPRATDILAHDIIHRRCQTQYNAPAVDASDGTLTYGELDAYSTNLAEEIRRRNISPGTYVPICMEKSRWVVVSVLGVMKSGGAFVLLDPTQPHDRLRGICHDLGASLVLTSASKILETAKVLAQDVLIVEENLFSASDAKNISLTMPLVSPQSPVYAAFTSGSTGKPKGAIISHRALATNLLVLSESLPLNTYSRVLQFASYAFDIAVLDIILTLFIGGCICIPSELERHNAIVEFIRQFYVNCLSLTPAVARLIPPSAVPAVKTIILAGEPVSPTDIARWPPDTTVIGGYGPAECTPITTIHLNLHGATSSTNIGHAPGAACWIVHPNDVNQLVPVGEEGELLIEGPLVGNGYIHNPKQTALSFIAAPAWLQSFRGRCPGIVYRTGDLARYNPDGSLQYIGRKDTQIKLNGQRIEAGEVEHHVSRALVGIQDVIVEVVSSTNGAQRLVLFLCWERQHEEQTEKSTSHTLLTSLDVQHSVEVSGLLPALQKCLPAYMVPQWIFCLHQRPLTSSGKVDRRRLREVVAKLSADEVQEYNCLSALAAEDGSMPENLDLPTTPLEMTLRDIWASILDVPSQRIKRQSNWVQLGGGSFLTMKLVAEARNHGMEITVQDVLSGQTLAAVAQMAGEIKTESKSVRPFTLLPKHLYQQQSVADEILALYERLPQPLEIEDIYPCTPMQRMWASQSITMEANYTMHVTATLPLHVDDDRLRNAWQTLVGISPALRTHIVQTRKGEFFQVVMKDRNALPLHFTPLEQNTHTNLWGLQKLLVRAAKHERHFELWIHHALCDGFTLTLLFHLLARLYHGEPLLAQPFNRFMQWLSCFSDETRTFWKRRFHGFHGVVFPNPPSDQKKPLASSCVDGGIVRLSEKTQRHHIASKLRLALAVALAVCMESMDVVFGETVWRRDAPVSGIMEMVGPTVARIPRRVHLDPKCTLADSLALILDQITEGSAHECADLEMIGAVSPEAAAACRFQTTLLVQPDYQEMIPEDFVDWKYSYPEGKVFAPWSMCVIGTCCSEGVHIAVVYDPRVLESTKASKVVDLLITILQRILADTQTRVGDLHLDMLQGSPQ